MVSVHLSLHAHSTLWGFKVVICTAVIMVVRVRSGQLGVNGLKMCLWG